MKWMSGKGMTIPEAIERLVEAGYRRRMVLNIWEATEPRSAEELLRRFRQKPLHTTGKIPWSGK